jgi:carboxypeptidase C (cathepsin A)
MLFLEHPAGVGFSYSNTTADYVVGDARAAEDVASALQAFITIHPELAANPLYITGESYGASSRLSDISALGCFLAWACRVSIAGQRRGFPAESA